MDDDDFTFPTVAAARGPTAPLGRRDDDPAPHLLQPPPFPSPNLAGGSPLWPFAGSIPKTTAAAATAPPVTADDEQERSAVEEDQRVAADEDRMDLLWEDTDTPTTSSTTRPVATAPESRSVAGRHAGPATPPKQRAAGAGVDDDKQRAAALADAERMDKLWESFNEDLVVLRHRDRGRRRRRRSKSAADHPGISNIKVSRAAGGPDGPADDDDEHWCLCHYYYSPSSASGAGDDESDDQETASASSPAERRGYGCAPTMLRASSRAGGAGQFCAASPRARSRRGRGAAAGWALLLRLFRRLFAVDRTAPSPSSRSHSSSIYVP